MVSHHDEPPEQPADAPEELEQDPDEKQNFTERHPEHFRNPPGHVSELREEPDASPKEG